MCFRGGSAEQDRQLHSNRRRTRSTGCCAGTNTGGCGPGVGVALSQEQMLPREVRQLCIIIVISHTFIYCRANILRMEPGTTPPPNQQSPLHLTPDHSFPEYATISEANLSAEPPVGVAATPNPSYGTSLSISKPHPSAEPGSGRLCTNPSYAVSSLPKQ